MASGDITLSEARTELDNWVAASRAVRAGQAVQMGDVSLTRVDASEIQQWIAYWRRIVIDLEQQAAGNDSAPGFVRGVLS